MLIECFCGCRNKIEQSCAYKAVLGGTRKVYFLNEQHYHRWQDKNSAKSNKIDEKERELQQNHVDRLTRNECTPAAGMLFSDIVSGLERVADHATNIAFSIYNSEEAGE